MIQVQDYKKQDQEETVSIISDKKMEQVYHSEKQNWLWSQTGMD